MTRQRDIYGRRPTSQSRGKTHERIMALQHAAGTLPGADGLLAGPDGAAPVAGSIAQAITSFHTGWVELQPVTVRRGYERALVLLARDLHDAGAPGLDAPAGELTLARLEAHLQWRVANGLVDRQELLRCGVHLHRLAEWLDTGFGTTLGATRDGLRAAALRCAGDAPAAPSA